MTLDNDKARELFNQAPVLGFEEPRGGEVEDAHNAAPPE